MWLFRKAPTLNPEPANRKDITEKMDKAIEELKLQSEARKNAIRARAVRYLEAHLDEITEHMLENMSGDSMRIHSKVYNVSEILGVKEEPFGESMMTALRGKDDNIFSKFLYNNKLTMGINNDATKVMFAYGKHSMFESGWSEWAGYDCY
jgi:hypothetical protein